MISLKSPVAQLAGVGDARAAQLNKLGIMTVRDLVYFFPRAYEDRGNVHNLTDISPSPCSYILTVATEARTAKLKNRLSLTKFRAFDDSASCEVVFFNSPYIKNVFHVGATFRFFGRVNFVNGRLQMSNPKYEPYVEGRALPELYPIYPLTGGLSSKILKKLIDAALIAASKEIIDPLPEPRRLKYELPTLGYAVKNLHAPTDHAALDKAIKRLAFDEALYFGLAIAASARYKTSVKGVAFSPCDMKAFTELLPYELTAAQKSAINDIYFDTVIKPKRKEGGHMARILVGDVGCGKTICAAAAIYVAVRSGFQSALMAPTEILARQHYAELSKLFSAFDVKIELLVGATSAKEKKRIYTALSEGLTDVVIGTHALLSDKVGFKDLGLVVTDEQHRFGVSQRMTLNQKSEAAHMLVMSATPIPRTLALTLYGDLDISRITEMPRGRQRVDTFAVTEAYRDRINAFIEKQLMLGGQCYVICPAIEAEEGDGEWCDDEFENASELKNVTEYAEKMRQIFANRQIGVLHGKLTASKKDEIMASFAAGEIDILVSTTVVEVGINVPNASLIVIENADRYGLSQLHQLRGRVGRGNRKSYCILISDSKSEASQKRLEIMKTTYDGFEIANKDLELRGPGDFFADTDNGSYRQSGGFEFKMTKLCNDGQVLENAFVTAKEIISADPNLELDEHRLLKEELSLRFSPTSASIS